MSFNIWLPPVVSDPVVLNAVARVGGNVIVAGGGCHSGVREVRALSNCSAMVL